ncbi:MAG: C40 family peptidase, partial [Nocardioides sp.]|uniref:C40 family peptidase n=1 Tax=Nocardioides sp. TaxID=35761 RepID=UPI0039E582D5
RTAATRHRTLSVRAAATRIVQRRILRVAASRRGTPYRYGGTGAGGFDCSGYTRWVFRRLGVSLPHSSAAQVGHTRRVSHPRKGDLVFFSSGGHVYHVGIYAGAHRLWHAPYSGRSVTRAHIWTRVFYGRVTGLRKAIRKEARRVAARRARAAAALA